jgi:hypothetical protein
MNLQKLDELLKITHQGCNILGLLNLFVVIIGMHIAVLLPGWPGRIFLLLLVVGCVVYDIVDRTYSKTEYGKCRCLFPSAGGSLLFVPVWTMYPLMAVVGLIVFLLQEV